MERQIAILNSNGTLSLSPEMQNSLGADAGSRLAVSIEEGRITLQPVATDLVKQLRGILRSSPGSTEELINDRRAEEQQAQRKQDRW